MSIIIGNFYQFVASIIAPVAGFATFGRAVPSVIMNGGRSGSVQFDNALLMTQIDHEWHPVGLKLQSADAVI